MVEDETADHGEGPSEEELDLVEVDEDPLPPDPSPEAGMEGGLTEGGHEPVAEDVEFEDEPKE